MPLDNFDFSKLGIFLNFNKTDSSAIVHLHDDGDKTVVGYGGQQGFTNWKVRELTDKRANNTARSELLVALGKATGLLKDNEGYVVEQDGRTKFTRENFIADLKKELGPEVVKALNMDGITDTFKMEDGYLVSGRPLTERRISCLMDSLYKETKQVRPADAPAVTVQGGANARFNAEAATFKEADATFIINFFKDQLNFPTTGKNLQSLRILFDAMFSMTDGVGNNLNDNAFQVLCHANVNADLFERALTTIQVGMRNFVQVAKDSDWLPKETKVPDASLAVLRKLAAASKVVGENGSMVFFKAPMAELPPWKRTFNLFFRRFNQIKQCPGHTAATYLQKIQQEVEQQALRRMRREVSPLDWIRTFVTSDRLNTIFGNSFARSNRDIAVGRSVSQALGMKNFATPEEAAQYAERLFKMVKEAVVEAMAEAAPDADDQVILDAAAGKFLEKLQTLARGDETFAAALPNGLTAADALNGLAGTLFAHNATKQGRDEFDMSLTRVGGGMPGQVSFKFQLDGESRQYDSHFESVFGVFKDFRVQDDDMLLSGNTPPLTGLSKSEITLADSQTPLITFSRFGSVGSRSGEKRVQYRQLATQTFLLNPALVKQVENGGEVDVPIFRVDMGESDNLSISARGRKLQDEIEPFSITFTPPKTDPNGAEPKPIKVTLKPRVVKFRLPTDSFSVSNRHGAANKADCVDAYKKGDNTLCEQNLIAMGSTDFLKTDSAMKELFKEVDKYGQNPDAPNREIVSNLWREVDKAFKEIAEHKVTDETDPDKGRIRWYAGFGADMQRLGARIALLVAKLGHVPAINCNWGRDRTGAMDNEIKMLAVKLHNGQELGPIMKGEADDGDVELRTEMLVKTGNAELAHSVNCTLHPINLDQSGASGMPKLFNLEKVVPLEETAPQPA